MTFYFMQKKLYAVCVIWLFLFLGNLPSLFASHMMGSDIFYTWVSGSTYNVTVYFYRDCAGSLAPNNIDIEVRSASCNYSVSYPTSRTLVGEVSAVCSSQMNNTTCGNGNDNYPGVQKYSYTRQITLPYSCSDWVFSWRGCCRNNAISTTNPGNPGDSIYLETTLNSLVASVNSSPTFSSLPVPYFCAGQLVNYNHGAVDPDGDSLVFEIIAPMETPTSTVTFINPYSATYPIATTPANSFSFSSQTGQMTFTPAVVQQGVTAIRVKEYRNGTYIGSTMRDIQLIILNCGNNLPASVDSTLTNVGGANYLGGNVFKTCVGNTITFSITATDPNVGTNIAMTSNNATAIPGSTFTTSGANPKVGTFTWTPTLSSVGYKAFTITITDGACPIPSTQVIGFAINVVAVDVSSPDFTMCPGVTTALQLGVTVGGSPNCQSGTCLTWTPATGLSATNIANPIATVSQPTTYTVNFNDGLCNVSKQVNILPAGSIVITTPDTQICPGTSIILHTTNSFPAAVNTNCNLNNALCVGGVNTLQVGSATTTTNNSTNLGIGTPYQGAYSDGKVQYLYKASELVAAGMVTGLIRSIAFNVTDLQSTLPYTSMTIKVGCYSGNAFNVAGGFISTNLYQVYSGNVIPVLGWNTYNFTTPFQWSPAHNVVVEICYNNTLDSDFDHVEYTATTYTSVLYKNANTGAGCNFTGPLGSNFRPNTQFTNCSQALPVTFSWASLGGSPVSSLNSTTTPNPTASPTVTNTIYQITATNGACTLRDTVTIGIRPQPTIGNTPNIVTCPLDTSILLATGTYINSYSWSTGVTGIDSIAVAPLNTTTYSVYALTDCGTLKDTIKVTTFDNIPPTILSCPVNDTVYVSANNCTYPYSWTEPTVIDNCPFPTISQTLGSPSGTPLGIGNHVIKYKALDPKGNQTFCNFIITVKDTFPPSIINCPKDTTVNNAPNQCGRLVLWQAPGKVDNCTVSMTQVGGIPNNGFFPVGTTLVTYIATDGSGNKDTCTFNVTVVDIQTPVLTLPADITIAADSGLCSAVVSWNPAIATDNCPGAYTTQISGIANGGIFPLGTSDIVYIATDSSGNSSAPDTMHITVIDTQAPAFVGCPTDIIVSNDTNQCGATISWTIPVAIDNCQGIIPINVLSSAQPGDFFPIGTTTIVYTVEDAFGNKDTCQFNITVSDNQFPLIVGCPSNILVPKDTNACGATVSWIEPTSTDNCGGMTFLQTAGLPSGSFFPLGPTTIIYVATDSVGNKDTCSFEVFVSDAFSPVIQNCPTNISVVNDTNVCGAVVNWVVPTIFDNCPGATLSVVTGLQTGSIFPIGTTTVTLVATDLALNTDTCIFTVTVTDVQVPVIQNCPNDTIINSALGLCGSNVFWTVPTVFDNCPNSTLVGSATPGDYFPIGTTTITYIATDSDNHTDTCSFTITLNDTEAPVFTGCPADIFQSSTPTSCDAVVTWTPPVATDNCALMSVVNNYNPGDIFPSGQTQVMYIATDSVGNIDTCSFFVYISDSTAPVISGCPANISLNTNGNCQAIATWTPPTVIDNCPVVSMISNYNSGDTFSLGTTTVIYIATDGVGNADSCIFTVTVLDSIAPVISACPTDIYFALKAGCDTAVTWTLPIATDNCAIASFGANYASGDIFGIGSYTVTYIATDSAGNADTCSFNIVIAPPQPLTWVGGVLSDVHCLNGNDGSIFVDVTGGSGTYLYTWTSTPIQNADTATNLTVGNYIVFVSDSNASACVTAFQDTFDIVQLPVLTVNVTGKNPTCYGFPNGTTTAFVTGGTQPYHFSWNNGDTLYNAPNLTIGTYSVLVTDAYNCTDTASITLIQPDTLSVIQTQTNVDCYNKATGAATVSVSGGTTPYTYSWNNGNTTSSISGLVDGTYTVLITDNNACTTLKTFVITEPALLTVSLSQSPVICHNSETGAAFAQVQGGTSPYTISWNSSPIQVGDSALNLPAGLYFATVTDAHGCITKNNTSLSNPPLLVLHLDETVNTYCSWANGSISTQALGGLAPYTYTWSTDTPQTTQNINLLMAGDYVGWVTDSLGCQDTLNVTLTDTPPAAPLFTSTPTNDNEILLSQAQISFQNQSTGAIAYSWNFGDTHTSVAVNPHHTFFKEGVYTVEMTAYNEFWVCPTTYSLTYNIIFDGAVFLPNAFSPNNDGKNDFFGAIGDGITYYQMTIFDRWGRIVFYSENPATQWGGTFEGKDVPEGVYTYRFKYRLNNAATKDLGGSVTVIR